MIITSNKKLIPLLVIIGGSALLLISFGIRHSFGLYLIPISDYLETGRELFSFASALNVLMIGIGMGPIGVLITGATAELWGAPVAVAINCVLGLLMLFGLVGKFKIFRQSETRIPNDIK